jgi:hypothetical protein
VTVASISAALIVTAALGVSFRTTRGIGIAAFAGLCLLHPWFAIVVLIGVSGLAYHFLRKR